MSTQSIPAGVELPQVWLRRTQSSLHDLLDARRNTVLLSTRNGADRLIDWAMRKYSPIAVRDISSDCSELPNFMIVSPHSQRTCPTVLWSGDDIPAPTNLVEDLAELQDKYIAKLDRERVFVCRL